ncbi:MAG: hypothetical protein L3J74_11230 [Bacteroidales bacterium]|nr:hypothetical protein [Bacteroidales bacterium]
MKKRYFIPVFSVLFLFAGFLLAYDLEFNARLNNKGGTEMVLFNYEKTIDSLAKSFDLPKDYLLALIMLESSGKKNVPVRCEKEVYRKLLLTQRGNIKGLEKINKKRLNSISKNDLKKLACSYGPFQIMGYKIFELNISLDELKGNNNIYWALVWINNNYGNYLRNKDYKNAFHLHNAGKKYPAKGKPETFDPDYVQKGLAYAKYFKKKINNEQN